MEPDKTKPLRELMEATPAAGDDGARLLQKFLRSVAAGSMDGHTLAAGAMYGVADDLDEPDRSLLLEQMFHVLMRALEDYATLCLMWLDPHKAPLEAFLAVDKPAIRQFYARARKGLGDDAMFRIFGVASPEAMKGKGLVSENDHYVLESVLGWAFNKYERLVAAFGRVYHSNVDEADPVIGPWQISYAMSALGTKMLLNEAGKPESLILGPGQAGAGAPAIFHAAVLVDSRFGEETLHHVVNVCREIRELANLQLALQKDPAAGLGRSRSQFENVFKSLKSGEEAVAPGGLRIIPGAPAVPGEVREIKETDEPGPVTHGPTETKELGGGLKITHTKPFEDDDEK